jgi:guanylate kinase
LNVIERVVCVQFEMVVSHTARPPRAHEVDGEHYHFRTKEEVARMQAEGLMLELQTVNGCASPFSWHASLLALEIQ